MPWFKVDDQLHSHPKARRSGLDSMGLWAISGSFCMAYKTDGFVPEWFVAAWPKGRSAAGRLVKAGLWDEAPDAPEAGWNFHDWNDFQPSVDEIERQRAHSRERQRKHRGKGSASGD